MQMEDEEIWPAPPTRVAATTNQSGSSHQPEWQFVVSQAPANRFPHQPEWQQFVVNRAPANQGKRLAIVALEKKRKLRRQWNPLPTFIKEKALTRPLTICLRLVHTKSWVRFSMWPRLTVVKWPRLTVVKWPRLAVAVLDWPPFL